MHNFRTAKVTRYSLLVACAILLGWGSKARAQGNRITVETDGITFDSNYENGSLASIASTGSGRFRAQLFVETGELGSRSYWFRFRMSGVAGRMLRIALDHSENRRPFIRVGKEPWRRMTAGEAPSPGGLVLDFGEDDDEAEVAFFEPLGLAETYAAVNGISQGSPFYKAEVIGKSVMGNDVIMTSVEDTRYPSAGKHRVWVHSRAHAGEVTSTHSMLGFLEQVLDGSETGRRLREHCIFHIVPILNVDGVEAGHTRWDTQGLDPERPWCNINIPSVQAVKDVVDAFMATENPIEVALNLHSTRGTYDDTFFFKHLAPSVSESFEEIQQRYIDAFAAATPLFNNLNPQTSQLNECIFIESYFWNNWGESVMALTHEGHYGRRITDNAYLTGADYREMGRAMATALVDYFDLPEATERDIDFDEWVAMNFSLKEREDLQISGPASDADGDGVSNVEEFFVQTDPRSPASILHPMKVRRGKIELTKAARAVATGFSVEQSSDLQNWSPLASLDTAKAKTSIDGNLERIARCSLLLKDSDSRYFRIRFP